MLTFEEIIKAPQGILKKMLLTELVRMGYKTQAKKGFLYAKGTIPVLLVAHLDTVHREPVKTICYSVDGSIMMSPEGIGGDDRAGVYMIHQLIRKHRCHVLFCEDEEMGGIGANAFVESSIKLEIHYILEFDRHGFNDTVFYDCENPEFTKFVTSFGFEKKQGSFSDISILAPALKVAAVNISAGYYNEHTRHEYINLQVIEKNIERVGRMVSVPTKKFEYIEVDFRSTLWDGYDYEVNVFQIKTLMLLPDTAYIKRRDGSMEECDGQYYVDDRGTVYEFLYDLEVALERKECEARTEHDLPVKFKEKDTQEVEIVPLEFILEG